MMAALRAAAPLVVIAALMFAVLRLYRSQQQPPPREVPGIDLSESDVDAVFEEIIRLNFIAGQPAHEDGGDR